MFTITAFLSGGCVAQDIGSAHLDDVTLLITDPDYLIQLHLAHKADALGPVTCGWPEVQPARYAVHALAFLHVDEGEGESESVLSGWHDPSAADTRIVSQEQGSQSKPCITGAHC